MEEKLLDSIHYWRHAGLPSIELSQAQFSRFSFAKHVHLDYHLGVVTQGAQQFMHRGQCYVLQRDCLSTLNPDETHDGQSYGAQGYRVKVMAIPTSYIDDICQELHLDDVFFSAPMVHDPLLYRYFIQLHYLFSQPNDNSLLHETELLSFICLLAQRHLGKRSQIVLPQQRLSASQLNLIKQRIHDEPWHNTKLESLAQEVNLSQFQFLRQFKQVTGMTPHAYLKRVRLELAKKALSRGTAVVEVAQHLGFFDQSHFHKAFKQAFLLSPQQFKRALNKC